MPSKAGMAPRRKGDRLEVRVVEDQRARGRWAARLRQAGGQVVDVLSFDRCLDGHCTLYRSLAHVRLIQCKADGYLLPAERAALVEQAERHGAKPLVAWSEGGEIKYREVTDGLWLRCVYCGVMRYYASASAFESFACERCRPKEVT